MRFKAYINNGTVVLDITPGQTIQHKTWKPTEEGYDAECLTYEACDEGITQTFASWGRDCDGDIGYESVRFCPWSKVKAATAKVITSKWTRWKEIDDDGTVHTGIEYAGRHTQDDPGWPEWEEESSEHYDQYAQAMNY